MGSRKYGAILIIGNQSAANDIRYATGYSSYEHVCLLDLGTRGCLMSVPDMEVNRARRQCHGRKREIEVVAGSQVSLEGYPPRLSRTARLCLALLKVRRVRGVITIPAYFPVGIADELRSAGLDLSVAAEVYPQRAVKTAEEIAHIARVQKVAVTAMRQARSLLAKAECGRGGLLKIGGRTLDSDWLRMEIEKVILENDCLPLEGTIVASGEDAADPHEAGSGPIKCGEPVVIDIFPRCRRSGYWGDLTRTYVKGPCSPELLKMYADVVAAQRAVLNAVRPKVSFNHLQRIAGEVIRSRKMKVRPRLRHRGRFIHGIGHGVGLDIHEAPVPSMEKSMRLAAGNVITVEPGLYYGGVGGVRVEDTIVVTEQGWRPLCRLGRKLGVD